MCLWVDFAPIHVPFDHISDSVRWARYKPGASDFYSESNASVMQTHGILFLSHLKVKGDL